MRNARSSNAGLKPVPQPNESLLPQNGAEPTMTTPAVVHPVDERLPTPRLAALGLQSDMTGKAVTRSELSAGLRTDGLGTVIGGLFNTFPTPAFRRTWAWWASPV